MKGVTQRKKHLNTPQLWRSCRTSHDSRSRNRAKRINTQRGDKQRAQNNRTEHAALRAHKKREERKKRGESKKKKQWQERRREWWIGWAEDNYLIWRERRKDRDKEHRVTLIRLKFIVTILIGIFFLIFKFFIFSSGILVLLIFAN